MGRLKATFHALVSHYLERSQGTKEFMLWPARKSKKRKTGELLETIARIIPKPQYTASIQSGQLKISESINTSPKVQRLIPFQGPVAPCSIICVASSGQSIDARYRNDYLTPKKDVESGLLKCCHLITYKPSKSPAASSSSRSPSWISFASSRSRSLASWAFFNSNRCWFIG